mgnify:CR=1 FL=1
MFLCFGVGSWRKKVVGGEMRSAMMKRMVSRPAVVRSDFKDYFLVIKYC